MKNRVLLFYLGDECRGSEASEDWNLPFRVREHGGRRIAASAQARMLRAKPGLPGRRKVREDVGLFKSEVAR